MIGPRKPGMFPKVFVIPNKMPLKAGAISMWLPECANSYVFLQLDTYLVEPWYNLVKTWFDLVKTWYILGTTSYKLGTYMGQLGTNFGKFATNFVQVLLLKPGVVKPSNPTEIVKSTTSRIFWQPICPARAIARPGRNNPNEVMNLRINGRET